MISVILEEAILGSTTTIAPNALTRVIQWIIDGWFATGRVGVDVLWHLCRQEGLGNAGGLSTEFGRMTERDIINQTSSADDQQDDYGEQKYRHKW